MARPRELLGGWLAERGYPDVIIGSKWGYRYTGDWRLDADQHEVKEQSLTMFTAQLAQSRALLGERLALHQVHSVTPFPGCSPTPRCWQRWPGCVPTA